MADRERSDAGTFVETVTLGAVRDVFDDVRGPVITSSDVSDALGCTTEAARQKLRRLVDRGEIDRRKTGRTVVYWEATDDGRREPATDAARSDPGEESGDAADGTARPPRIESDDEALRSIVRDALAGSGDLLERRVGEILKMYAYLREHGTGEKSDLLDAVDVRATGYAGRDSVWSNMVKGSDTLRALPGVRKPPDGRSVWEYDPDAVGGGET